MTEPVFFFDTADLDHIRRTWDKLSKTTKAISVAGITTNPNALAKVGCDNLKKFETLVAEGTKLLTEILPTGDAEFHVQYPLSTGTAEGMANWFDYARGLGDQHSKVAIKIAPYPEVLKYVQRIWHSYGRPIINVTGISDAATALRVLTYPCVRYASIIPGRMEEVGIHADLHLFATTMRYPLVDSQDVIAGSMRTVDGLKRSIVAGCVPTIGTRVWDSMTEADYEQFPTWWDYNKELPSYLVGIPFTDDRNLKLTQDFFTQMDILGTPLYEEFMG